MQPMHGVTRSYALWSWFRSPASPIWRIRSAAQSLGHTFAALQGLLQDPAATLVPGQFQQGTWQPVTSSHTEPGND